MSNIVIIYGTERSKYIKDMSVLGHIALVCFNKPRVFRDLKCYGHSKHSIFYLNVTHVMYPRSLGFSPCRLL